MLSTSPIKALQALLCAALLPLALGGSSRVFGSTEKETASASLPEQEARLHFYALLFGCCGAVLLVAGALHKDTPWWFRGKGRGRSKSNNVRTVMPVEVRGSPAPPAAATAPAAAGAEGLPPASAPAPAASPGRAVKRAKKLLTVDYSASTNGAPVLRRNADRERERETEEQVELQPAAQGQGQGQRQALPPMPSSPHHRVKRKLQVSVAGGHVQAQRVTALPAEEGA